MHNTLGEEVDELCEGLKMGDQIGHTRDGPVESERHYAIGSDHGDESAS
jgi:hypothetical protein